MARAKAPDMAPQGMMYRSPSSSPPSSPPIRSSMLSSSSAMAQGRAEAALRKLREEAEVAKSKEAAKVAREMKMKEQEIEANLRRQEKKVAVELATALRMEAVRAEKATVKDKEKVERQESSGTSGRGKKAMVAVEPREAERMQQRDTWLAATTVAPELWFASLQKRSREAMMMAGGVGGEVKKPKTVAEESSIVGEWEVQIPDDDCQDDCRDDYYLSVRRSNSGHLEAAFFIAPLEGTMRFDKKKPTPKDRTLKFKWRGREIGEQEVKVGADSDYTGKIFLDGTELLDGFFDGPYGMINFKGRKISEDPEHHVEDWDSFLPDARERERDEAPWGGRSW